MSEQYRNYSEKRDFKRMMIDAKVTLTTLDKQSFPGVCQDLSSTGMQVEAQCDLQVGDQLHFHMASPHEVLCDMHADVEVKRVIKLADGRQQLGLLITKMQ